MTSSSTGSVAKNSDKLAALDSTIDERSRLLRLQYSAVGNPRSRSSRWDWDKDSDPKISRAFAFDHEKPRLNLNKYDVGGSFDRIQVHPVKIIQNRLEANGIGGIDLGPYDGQKSRYTTDDGQMFGHITEGRLASFDYLKDTASERPWMRDWEKVLRFRQMNGDTFEIALQEELVFPQADTERMWYWTRVLTYAVARKMKVPQCLVLLYLVPRHADGTSNDDPDAVELLNKERLSLPKLETQQQRGEADPHFLVGVRGPSDFMGNSSQEAVARRWNEGLWSGGAKAKHWDEGWWYHFERNSFSWDVSSLWQLQVNALKCDEKQRKCEGIHDCDSFSDWFDGRCEQHKGKFRKEFRELLSRPDVIDSFGDSTKRPDIQKLLARMLRFTDHHFDEALALSVEVDDFYHREDAKPKSLFEPYCPIAYDLCSALVDFVRNLPDARIFLVFLLYDILADCVIQFRQNNTLLANADDIFDRTRVFPPVLRSLWRALTDRLLQHIPSIDRSRLPMCLSDVYVVCLDYEEGYRRFDSANDEGYFESDWAEGWNFLDEHPETKQKTKVLASRVCDWRDCRFLVDWARAEIEKNHTIEKMRQEKEALQEELDRARASSGVAGKTEGAAGGIAKRSRLDLESGETM